MAPVEMRRRYPGQGGENGHGEIVRERGGGEETWKKAVYRRISMKVKEKQPELECKCDGKQETSKIKQN